jgi:hypothetical protein
MRTVELAGRKNPLHLTRRLRRFFVVFKPGSRPAGELVRLAGKVEACDQQSAVDVRFGN